MALHQADGPQVGGHARPSTGEPAAPRIRVFLVEDHEVVRTGLRLIIERQPDMELAGEAARGDDALALALRLQPDVAVVDVRLPGLNGAQLTEALTRRLPETRVLVLSAHDDPTYVCDLLRSGARGYILKAGPASELCQAIRAVAAGACYIDARLAHHLARSDGGHVPAPCGTAGLTDREQEALRLLALGYTHREVAQRMAVSVKTVDTYRARIAEKLGLHNRPDLVRYALFRGLLDAEDGNGWHR